MRSRCTHKDHGPRTGSTLPRSHVGYHHGDKEGINTRNASFEQHINAAVPGYRCRQCPIRSILPPCDLCCESSAASSACLRSTGILHDSHTPALYGEYIFARQSSAPVQHSGGDWMTSKRSISQIPLCLLEGYSRTRSYHCRLRNHPGR